MFWACGNMKTGIKPTYEFLKRNIDWKKGALFGGLAGIAVGIINYSRGIDYALSSGSKEGAKCLLVGTMNLSLCRKFATSIENKYKAYAVATIIPATLSIGLTYGVHKYLRGTAYPLKSTAPTVLSAPFFLGIGIRERRLMERRLRKSELEKM